MDELKEAGLSDADAKTMMSEMDADRDGFVSTKDEGAGSELSDFFKTADDNGDGLGEDEFKQIFPAATEVSEGASADTEIDSTLLAYENMM